MKPPISGGCACGAVRYRSEAAVEFAFNCHCRKCQRATGGGHASAFALPRADTEITGDITYFEQGSDAGARTHSGFCAICGSPLVSRTERFPERLYFYAATLDDPSGFVPGFAVFEDAAQPWDPVDPKSSNAPH